MVCMQLPGLLPCRHTARVCSSQQLYGGHQPAAVSSCVHQPAAAVARVSQQPTYSQPQPATGWYALIASLCRPCLATMSPTTDCMTEQHDKRARDCMQERHKVLLPHGRRGQQQCKRLACFVKCTAGRCSGLTVLPVTNKYRVLKHASKSRALMIVNGTPPQQCAGQATNPATAHKPDLRYFWSTLLQNKHNTAALTLQRVNVF